jgi:hypothetical protein
MTKHEFILQTRTRERQFKQRGFWGGIFVALLLIGMAVVDYLQQHDKLHWAGSLDLRTVIGVLWLVCVGYIGIIAILSTWPGAQCPHCRKQLYGAPAQIAVATGNCGYCGEKAFD